MQVTTRENQFSLNLPNTCTRTILVKYGFQTFVTPIINAIDGLFSGTKNYFKININKVLIQDNDCIKYSKDEMPSEKVTLSYSLRVQMGNYFVE